jgi:hypothetical protein
MFFLFGKTFCSLRIFFRVAQYLGWLSPAAPAAGSAASGPDPVPAPGRGRPHRSWLASSLLLAASPPALLTSRVCVAALIGRQLAGQPERGQYRLGRRRRRRLHRFGRRGGGVDLTDSSLGITDSSLDITDSSLEITIPASNITDSSLDITDSSLESHDPICLRQSLKLQVQDKGS